MKLYKKRGKEKPNNRALLRSSVSRRQGEAKQVKITQKSYVFTLNPAKRFGARGRLWRPGSRWGRTNQQKREV